MPPSKSIHWPGLVVESAPLGVLTIIFLMLGIGFAKAVSEIRVDANVNMNTLKCAKELNYRYGNFDGKARLHIDTECDYKVEFYYGDGHYVVPIKNDRNFIIEAGKRQVQFPESDPLQARPASSKFVDGVASFCFFLLMVFAGFAAVASTVHHLYGNDDFPVWDSIS